MSVQKISIEFCQHTRRVHKIPVVEMVVVQLFYADKGYYPYSGAGGGNVLAHPGQTLAIPGLTPDYIDKIPSIPNDGRGGYYAYIWYPNGSEYKVVRLASSADRLPIIEQSNPNSDTARPGRGWGYWSPGGSAA